MSMVYVDQPDKVFKGMFMCHMVADNPTELHAMAGKLNLRREWFQYHPTHPHYDVSKAKRALAIQRGAKEVSNRELVEIIRRQNA